MNTTFDAQFQKIDNLKWLPWIGGNYTAAPLENRLLIIGESHYHDGTPQSIDKHKREGFTREIVVENAIGRDYYKTKFFPNLHKALFLNDEFNSQNLWSNVCFYNFIQRPMNMNTKERPSRYLFEAGWQVFYEVISVVQPSVCLFIGTSSTNTFNKSIKKSGLISEGVVAKGWIDRTYPRFAQVNYANNLTTNAIFIKHTSGTFGGFDWNEWHSHLKNIIPGQLNWLQQQLN